MPRSSWSFKGKPTKLSPTQRAAQASGEPMPRPPPFVRKGVPRGDLWTTDDEIVIAHVHEGRTLAELCAALPNRTERQVIARVRQLRQWRKVGKDEVDTLLDRERAATGIPADPARVARHWLRQGATQEQIAAHLRVRCPRPHGWPPSAVAEVCGGADVPLIDVRKLLPKDRKLS